MSVVDRFLKFMSINPEEEEYDDDFQDESDYDYSNNSNEGFGKSSSKNMDTVRESEKQIKSTSRTINSKIPRKVNTNDMEVCVIKPTTFEEASEITDTLLSNKAVVLNLEGLDMDIAQRIIDYTVGSCYAIRGNLQKISNYILIITPVSVNISGDTQEMLANSFL